MPPPDPAQTAQPWNIGPPHRLPWGHAFRLNKPASLTRADMVWFAALFACLALVAWSRWALLLVAAVWLARQCLYQDRTDKTSARLMLTQPRTLCAVCSYDRAALSTPTRCPECGCIAQLGDIPDERVIRAMLAVPELRLARDGPEFVRWIRLLRPTPTRLDIAAVLFAVVGSAIVAAATITLGNAWLIAPWGAVLVVLAAWRSRASRGRGLQTLQAHVRADLGEHAL